MAFSWTRAAVCLVLSVSLLTGCGAASSSEAASASGAGSASAASTPAPQEDGFPTALVLGYTPSTGFNPYLANSNLVAQNAGLLFEDLVRIGPDMSLEYRLAQSIQCAGTTVTIQMRPGCTFADGTAITAQDAAASLQAAKASEMYAARFANVLEIQAQGSAVQLTLEQPDSMFAYLCDIPVLKAAETASQQPTASGRYTYGSGAALVRNPGCAFAEPCPDTIYLTQVGSYEEMTSGLAMGTLNLYTAADLDEAVSGFSSLSEYYRTNNLVFVGVNAAVTEGQEKSPLLTTPGGRALLSQLIDRRQIAEKSFYSRAYPATGIINNYYDCVSGQQVILAEGELDAAAAQADFAALGYTLDPATGYYQDADGQRLRLRLTVHSGSTYKRYAASLLKEQMAEKGLYLELDEVPDFDTYTQKIAAGDFDLYIGEVKLYNNMDMSPFFEGGQASAGIVQSEALRAAYDAFKADVNAAGAFETAFAAEMPLVPLVWRHGMVVHSQGISGLSCSISDPFYSLADLRFGQAQ